MTNHSKKHPVREGLLIIIFVISIYYLKMNVIFEGFG